MDTDVLIVGGGVSGLAVAWWLAQRGVRTEVWERAAEPGGLIATQRAQGYTMEMGASLMLNFRPEVAALLAQCGLDAQKLPVPRELPRFVAQRGALARVPTGAAALLFAPLLSRAARLRLVAEPLVARARDEAETVSEFVARRLGREPLEKLFEPLVAATFGCDPDLAQAAAVLPRLTALERRFGSLVLGACAGRFLRRGAAAMELFSFAGGLGSLTGALAGAAGAAGMRLRTRCTAHALARVPTGWSVAGQGAGGAITVRAAHVVLSVPAPQAAALLGAHDAELARLVGSVEYAPLAVVHLGFARSAVRDPLHGMGFLAPRAESRVLLGCQWLGGVFADRAPSGRVLLSAYLGGARAAQIAGWNGATLADEALHALAPLLGVRGTPEMVRVAHHRQALPLYHGAHLQRVRHIAARLERWPGLHLAANYLDGVSTRDRLASGCATACRIASRLSEAGAGARAAPSMPSMPSMPSVPSVPSAPSVPSMPSAPSAPSAPSVPSLPSLPSVPSVPSTPVPGTPRVAQHAAP